MQFFPESRDDLEDSTNTGNRSKVRQLGDISVKVPLGICIQIGLLNTVQELAAIGVYLCVPRPSFFNRQGSCIKEKLIIPFNPCN